MKPHGAQVGGVGRLASAVPRPPYASKRTRGRGTPAACEACADSSSDRGPRALPPCQLPRERRSRASGARAAAATRAPRLKQAGIEAAGQDFASGGWCGWGGHDLISSADRGSGCNQPAHHLPVAIGRRHDQRSRAVLRCEIGHGSGHAPHTGSTKMCT